MAESLPVQHEQIQPSQIQSERIERTLRLINGRKIESKSDYDYTFISLFAFTADYRPTLLRQYRECISDYNKLINLKEELKYAEKEVTEKVWNEIQTLCEKYGS